MVKYLLSIAACLPFLIHAQHLPETRTWIYEPEQEPREHPVNMTHLKVEVHFEPEKGIVNGKVTHVFQPLWDQVDSIFLDAPGIQILKASRKGLALKFSTSEKGITVYPNPPCRVGQTDSIELEYTCKPLKGIYFIGWNDPTHRSRKQIWTQGQGTDNRYWIPMYDEMNDKVISETRITFADTMQVLSNGNLISETKAGKGMKTWHYKMDHPHAPYLIMIGIGKYSIEKRKTKAGTPVSLWYYPEYPEQREPSYLYSTECIDFLEEMTGIPYPWKSYANIPVQDFLYGAMENTTATVFGDFLLTDKRMFIDRNYIGVNVHELTHQWFGDYVTARSAKSSWLQESYATFYPKRFFRKIYGEDYYEWQLRGEHNSALKASEKDLLPIVHSRSGSARWYPKGSAVIDMMYYTFGEESMRRVIHHYLKKHAYANVETQDLYQSFQDTLGLSPFWFFDQWLYRGGEPHYQVKWNAVQSGPSAYTEIEVKQIQPITQLEGLFKMPVIIEVHYTDGSQDEIKTWISQADEIVRIPNPENKKAEYVLFDPGSRILKKLSFRKSREELFAQAVKARHFIDRYDAIAGLREYPIQDKSVFLREVYSKENFHPVKTEILSQLSTDESPETQALRIRALQDKSAEVRLSALQNTKTIQPDQAEPYENLLRDSSYNVLNAALEKLSRTFPEKTIQYLDITRNETGPGHKTRILRLELMAEKGDTSALHTLSDLCSQGFEFITRQNAMQALKRLNYLDDTTIVHMLNAVMNPNYKLGGTAAQILKDFMQQTQWKNKISEQIQVESQKYPEKKIFLQKYDLL